MNYVLHLLIYFSVFSIVGMSLNIVVGYCGLLSLAHASYFAVGAYVYAVAALNWGWGFIPATLLAVVVGAVLSLVLALPTWRLKGDFFVMASLAVQALVYSAAYNWTRTGARPGSWANLTGGPFGLSGVPHPGIVGIRLDTLSSMSALAMITALACLGLSAVLLRSPWGRALQAMRDDELAARGLGKNVRLMKLQAIMVACSLAAVGGSIYSYYAGYVDPSLGSLDQSILLLAMVVVGGAGNVRGTLVGVLVLLLFPEALRFARIPNALASELRLAGFGLLLVLLVHFRPRGLAGTYRVA
jgi:branched-chain amino acid transport system permease protein